MKFKSKDLVNLRRRLGWSQSEMARQLSCDLSQIQEMESGSRIINKAVFLRLNFLIGVAERNLEFSQNQVSMESVLRVQNLSQVSKEQIDESAQVKLKVA